jgi:hypothetical protein
MTKRRLPFILGGGVLVLSTAATLAQNFPSSPANESTTSLGRFAITVDPAFRPLFPGDLPPGYAYNPTNHILTSPLLFDPNTTIGVSANIPGGVGGGNETDVPTGAAASGPPPLTQTLVSNNASFFPVVPPAFSGAAMGTPLIFTKVQLFNLAEDGTHVLAGSAAPSSVPGSFGQVQAQTEMGDFPARSFFDIFVDIQVPLPMGGTVDLENTAPLVVESQGLTSLPPTVLYTHSKTTVVPLFIVGGPNSGDEFGTVQLAAHGVGYNDTPQDQMMFNMQWAMLGGTVPEPSSWAMMLIGFGGLSYLGFRARRSKELRAA